MSYEIIFTPDPPHICDLPEVSSVLAGTIVRCIVCGKFYKLIELDASKGFYRFWETASEADVQLALAQQVSNESPSAS